MRPFRIKAAQFKTSPASLRCFPVMVPVASVLIPTDGMGNSVGMCWLHWERANCTSPFGFLCRVTAMCCVCLPEDQIPHGFPTIDMGPQLKVVERTRTATMLCAASGNPDPEIHWFKDFLPVDTGSSNGRIKQLRSGKAVFSLG